MLCLLATALRATPPAPLSALYRPTFLWADRSVTAGRGFLIRQGSLLHERTLFLSCFHVLGGSPAGVLGVAGISAEARPRMITSLRHFPTPAPSVYTDHHAGGELTVFEISDPPRDAARLRLSPRPPQRGESVYLFSQAFGEKSVRLHRARISQVEPGCLDYVFDDADLELGGTSGSPVLDEQGRVVGINVAGYTIGDRLHGIANPAVNVIAAINAALASPRDQRSRAEVPASSP